MAANALFVVKPYKWSGQWVFDDERVGLDKEPFVAGADTMIDTAVQALGIQNAEHGFLIIFSAGPFPGAQIELEWVREEYEGNVYRRPDTDEEGWLCPALLLYFSEAPKRLCVQFKEAT